MYKLNYFPQITSSLLLFVCCSIASEKKDIEKIEVEVVLNQKLKMDNSNGHVTTSSSDSLCTFYAGDKLKDCILCLSEKQLNTELHTHNPNRLRTLWRMLTREQKKDLLVQLDKRNYEKLQLIDTTIPQTKAELLKNISNEPISRWSVRAVAATIATSAFFFLKSQLQ